MRRESDLMIETTSARISHALFLKRLGDVVRTSRVFLCLVAMTLIGGCGDVLPPTAPHAVARGEHPRPDVTCGVECLTLPQPVPGAASVTLGYSNSYTGIDSVAWPLTYANRTRVRMTVTGMLSRTYVTTMHPSFAATAGQPYFPLDANAEYASSQCWGDVYTAFRLPSGYWGDNLSACDQTPTNSPAYGGVPATSKEGVISGSGYIQRWGMYQPSWPGYTNCNNGPCVMIVSGLQTIDIEPIAQLLSLTATPDSIAEGDSVLFQATRTGSLTMTMDSWIWMPDSVAGAAGSTSDTRTGQCNSALATCKIPVFRTGTMYVRAFLGSGSSRILEQAAARVIVTPLVPTLIVSCTPGGALRGTAVQCSAHAEDARGTRIPFTLTTQEATSTDPTVPWTRTDTVNAAYSASATHTWSGTRAVSTSVEFRAAANFFEISGAASFTVTARTWSDWQIGSILDSIALYPPQIVNPLLPGNVVGGFHAGDGDIFTTAAVDSTSQGPNKGLYFFANRPNNPRGFIYTHPALYAGHPWYNDQNGLGSGTCLQTDIPPFRTAARRHEGVTMALNSHVGVADSLFAQYHPQQDVELIVFPDANIVRILGWDAYRGFVSGSVWQARHAAFDAADYPTVQATYSHCSWDFNLSDS